MCFYGDLFRRDPQAVDDGFEQSRAGVSEMLAKAAQDAGFAAIGEAAGQAAYERTVDLVTTMATEPNLRQRVPERIDSAVTDDTRVIVGHSLGSVVSYSALRRHPEWKVHTLVTLGSPLGHPIILGQLEPPVTSGEGGPWPGSAQRWVNVAAVGDRVASVGRLADVFGTRIEDVLIDNGQRPHDPEPYLNAWPTGAAIADALTIR